jgi:hypothetical protein
MTANKTTTTAGTKTIDISADAFDRLNALAAETGKSIDDILEAGLSRLQDGVPAMQAALAIVRERMNPYQWGLIVAGAKIEDALALNHGSMLDPEWAKFVSPTTSAKMNVMTLLEGFETDSEPGPDAVAAVQSIITDTLRG